MKRGLVLVLGLLGACAVPGRRVEPGTALERGIFFAEEDERGREHGISGLRDSDARTVERLADGRRVDVNSKIAIEVRKDELVPAAPATMGLDSAGDLGARAVNVEQVLRGLAGEVEARLEALRSWERLSAAPDDEDAQDAFSAAKRSFGLSELQLTDSIERLWPETHPRRPEVEEAFEAFVEVDAPEEAETSALGILLQGEIDAVHAEARRLGEAAEERTVALRLEAFLIPSDQAKTPVPIHLEGYDTLDRKEIRSISRFGLALNEHERRELAEAMAAAGEIARAAEALRRGEAELSAGLRDARTELGRRLGEFAAEVEALASELAAENARARLDGLRGASRAFFDELVQALADEARAQARTLGAETLAEIDTLARGVDGVAALVSALERLPRIRDGWRRGNANELPQLITESIALAEDLRAVLADVDGLVHALRTLRDSLGPRLETLPAGFSERALEVWAASALRAELGELAALASRSRSVARPVAALLGIGEVTPLATGIRVPEALDVPVDDARDTHLDLRRTQRATGDLVEVRATLVRPGEAPVSESSTFRLAKLGWHADLVPSVVLATADQVAGARDSGGFSPAVNWVLRYGARDDEEGKLAGSARFLGWGLGLHAIFLNFDTQNDAEVGLGATVSLWSDRLLLGTGVNVLADSDDEGRYYYFVGSSLIPLLQALRPGD